MLEVALGPSFFFSPCLAYQTLTQYRETGYPTIMVIPNAQASSFRLHFLP